MPYPWGIITIPITAPAPDLDILVWLSVTGNFWAILANFSQILIDNIADLCKIQLQGWKHFKTNSYPDLLNKEMVPKA